MCCVLLCRASRPPIRGYRSIAVRPQHVDARDDLGHTVFLGLFEHLVVVHDFGENPQQTQHEENPDKGWEMRDGFEYGNEDESADTEEENRFLFPGRDEIAAGNDAVSLG